MNEKSAKAYQKLLQLQKELALFQGVESLLRWDQETQIPVAGNEVRSRQLALMSGLIHERFVSAETGELLSQAESGASEEPGVRANLKEIRRRYDRETRLPRELVEEVARASSLSQAAWIEARKKKDFSRFAPWLEKMIELKRETARSIGADESSVYSVLLDEFEPGEEVSSLDEVFSLLGSKLPELVQRLQRCPRKVDPALLKGKYPTEKQREFGLRIIQAMGFNLNAGRLDVTAHPFCTEIGGPDDVRITTRYAEADVTSALFAMMHEAGHGLYEQGLRKSEWGTPLGRAVSSGVHESQSRLWENQVGRSPAFWEHFYPELQAVFPEPLARVSRGDFLLAINRGKPSFIRVEADEVTYNLHILLRYELERDLISKRLSVSDLPARWNRRMEELLGITPPDDSLGCLQDVHWSLGLFGYFPTYTLGNIYAAQIFATAHKAFDLEGELKKGKLTGLREWLRKSIHEQGMLYSPQELIRKVTGQPRSAQALVDYLERKYSELYGI